MLTHEQELIAAGYDIVIGIDEAGRGPLAGPVVASAVSITNPQFLAKIADSKSISELLRETAFHEIFENAHVGIGIISESVIDEINILEATYLAMSNAVRQLMFKIEAGEKGQGRLRKKVCLMVDGNRFKSDLPYAYKTYVDGDNYVFSISCASIVAKVTRDRILKCYDQVYPQYGFAKHKGYPTKAHREAIQRHGISLIHRKSFACL